MATFTETYTFVVPGPIALGLIEYNLMKDFVTRNQDGGGLLYGYTVTFTDATNTMTLTKTGSRSNVW